MFLKFPYLGWSKNTYELLKADNGFQTSSFLPFNVRQEMPDLKACTEKNI